MKLYINPDVCTIHIYIYIRGWCLNDIDLVWRLLSREHDEGLLNFALIVGKATWCAQVLNLLLCEIGITPQNPLKTDNKNFDMQLVTWNYWYYRTKYSTNPFDCPWSLNGPWSWTSTPQTYHNQKPTWSSHCSSLCRNEVCFSNKQESIWWIAKVRRISRPTHHLVNSFCIYNFIINVRIWHKRWIYNLQ